MLVAGTSAVAFGAMATLYLTAGMAFPYDRMQLAKSVLSRAGRAMEEPWSRSIHLKKCSRRMEKLKAIWYSGALCSRSTGELGNGRANGWLRM
jgi:hypothetical protein